MMHDHYGSLRSRARGRQLTNMREAGSSARATRQFERWARIVYQATRSRCVASRALRRSRAVGSPRTVPSLSSAARTEPSRTSRPSRAIVLASQVARALRAGSTRYHSPRAATSRRRTPSFQQPARRNVTPLASRRRRRPSARATGAGTPQFTDGRSTIPKSAFLTSVAAVKGSEVRCVTAVLRTSVHS